MSQDHFTETTSRGWFSRIGSAFGGVLFGVVLIFVGIGVLAWNENRAVRTERALNEGAGVVVSVEPDPILPANEGALIHVSGDTTVQAPIQDSQWGVTATGLRLIRNVEMYQWRETSRSETRTKLGGGEETVTTYDYDRVWSDSRQDSSNFRIQAGHHNPEFPVEAASYTAADARLGAFELDDRVIERVGGTESVSFDEQARRAIQDAAGRDVTVSATTIYLGANPDRPQVGDTRVSYEIVPADEISVVAQQSGEGFAPYRADNGETVLLVSDGIVSSDEMFEGAQSANRMLLWAIRVGGMIALITGFGLILAPLKVLADVIPILGSIVGMGTGLVAFLLGTIVGTVTIALAWFAVRPLLSIGILAVGGLIAFGLWRMGRGRVKRQVQAEPAEAEPAEAEPPSDR